MTTDDDAQGGSVEDGSKVLSARARADARRNGGPRPARGVEDGSKVLSARGRADLIRAEAQRNGAGLAECPTCGAPKPGHGIDVATEAERAARDWLRQPGGHRFVCGPSRQADLVERVLSAVFTLD